MTQYEEDSIILNKRNKSLQEVFTNDLELIVKILAKNVLSQSLNQKISHISILAIKKLTKGPLENLLNESLKEKDAKLHEYMEAVINIP